jgi:hypothetical protein
MTIIQLLEFPVSVVIEKAIILFAPLLDALMRKTFGS